MSADWSAIRRRQTLGEVQNHATASQIPQPSSVFKKSAAGRASVAPGGLAGLGPPPRSSLAPQRFVRSSSGGNLADSAATFGSSQSSSQRESLRNSRQSYAPQQSLKYVFQHAALGHLVLIIVDDGRVRILLDGLHLSAFCPRPQLISEMIPVLSRIKHSWRIVNGISSITLFPRTIQFPSA